MLYDVNRNVFVELNENDSNYGKNENELRHLYNGEWSDKDYQKRLRKAFNNNDTTDLGFYSSPNLIEEDDSNSDNENVNLVWVAENGYNVFESSSGDNWIEKLNGEPTFHFQVAAFNNKNGILLYDYDREIYVELNENDSNYGATEDNLRPLYAGSWSNDDFEKRLDKLNNNLLANQLKTKRTYSTSRSDFGEYIFILKSLSLPLFISFKICFYF